ncbi:hypothetical protein [Elizabethkingia anophelis]|uniref:hypothetical protein n=1 Tax=Elizabethkingia anophelis TaxID=1117645 RepID=UPI00301C94AE
MKNKQKTQGGLRVEVKERRNYIPPLLEIIAIEMECGIAAASAAVVPDQNPTDTDWNGSDDTTIDTPF